MKKIISTIGVAVLAIGGVVVAKTAVVHKPVESACNVRGIKLHGELDTYTGSQEFSADQSAPVDMASSEDIVHAIDEANASSSIKGIVLEVDSPGGDGVAGEEIAATLKRSQKPTVGWIRSKGVSAAYWAVSGAQHIIAADISDVGDIGVTTSYTDVTKKNKDDGLTFHQLSMGKFKDMQNPNKSLTPEEQDLIKNELQIDYDRFVAAVAENRHFDLNKAKALADGAPHVGLNALQEGLIDQLGGLPEAEDYIKAQTGEKEIRICW